ncbi:MAG TPA: hypothetical protein ENJ80_09965 [Gammaproteobacteria bacterium]|nr:hypothetical protein [Gammaproteobacteria bacterium]
MQTSYTALSDRVDLGSAAGSPLKVLDSEVLDALDEELKENGVSLDRQADPASFTPQQVADRILGVIEAALSQYAADDPQRAGLLERAREGVERAFEEARGILEGLGVLQGELADSITATSELIQAGLERLSTGEPAVVPGDTGSDETPLPATAVQQVALGAVGYSTSQVTSLVIDTVDGDRITIDISKQASVSRAGVLAQSDAAQLQGFQSGRDASVTFSFNVQGELDADEQKAVESLLRRIDRVSDRFFEGDVQKAFASAARLKFDSEELAGFALDLRSTESYSAVAAYRQTAGSDAAAGGSLQDVAGFGADIRGLIDTAAANTRFAEPARDVARLFGAMTDERASGAIAELKDEATSMLRGLVSSIVAGFGGKVDDDDAGGHAEPEHAEAAEHETDDS